MTTPRTAAGRALLERRSAFNGGKHASVTLPSEQWNEAILAIEAEARAPYTDPQDRWRLVRVAPDVLAQWGTRTEDGDRLTVEWGEPDDDGIYEPAFTRHSDDNLRAAALDAVAESAGALDVERLSSLVLAALAEWTGEPSDGVSAAIRRAIASKVAAEYRAESAGALDDDVRAILAAWGMSANVMYVRDTFEAGEAAIARLRARLAEDAE